MQPIGLTFDEMIELKCQPGPLMTLPRVCGQLQARGYDCRPPMLEMLIHHGVVIPVHPDAWSQADVDAAAAHFENSGIFTCATAMCELLGCRYADYLRALRKASKLASIRYGRHVPEEDQYFVMHRVPPRHGKPPIITFTLCNDVRERLERGKDV